MGLLITVYLITVNVYEANDAPPGRKFSYFDLWMIAVQFCILLATLEYGFILSAKKFYDDSEKLSKLFKIVDLITFIVSLTFFVIFNVFYWYQILS